MYKYQNESIIKLKKNERYSATMRIIVIKCITRGGRNIANKCTIQSSMSLISIRHIMNHQWL